MLRQQGNADLSLELEDVTQRETSASYRVVSAQLNQKTVEIFAINNFDNVYDINSVIHNNNQDHYLVFVGNIKKLVHNNF